MALGMLMGSLAISAASGYMKYRSAQNQHAQTEAQSKLNSQLIDKELKQSYSDNLLRAMQEMMAVKTTLEDEQRTYLEQKGTAVTSAGESGVSGNSVDTLMGDLDAQRARSADRHRQNYSWTLEKLRRERKSLGTQAQRAKAGLPRSNKPNVLTHALGTAGGMANTYMANKK